MALVTTRTGSWSVAAGVLMGAGFATSALATPVLRSADVRITMTSPTSCDVTMDLTVTGASDVDHRIASFEGSRVELVDVRGARRSGDLHMIGRTESLVLSPGDGTYGFRYRALQSESRANRCPIWLPAVPTDGRPGAVRVIVDIPPAMFPGSSMPAFTWAGTRGSAALAHLPSHVVVRYGPEGAARGWDVGRIMDALAMTVFAAASAIWLWRARR
jgi:hypothetical protein